MIQPHEMSLGLSMKIANDVITSTSHVWKILVAAEDGDLEAVKQLAGDCPELLFAKYNYAAPIHFAAREGHMGLVAYLLEQGAYDPSDKSYPFQESLAILAMERGYLEIADTLNSYPASAQRFHLESGIIDYNRTKLQQAFEETVDGDDVGEAKNMLQRNPEFAKDETYFWGEGILLFAAKDNNREMIDLLMSYNASVPKILKWAPAYYFEHREGTKYMMERGMDPNTMSCHRVTILHNMAQKGNLEKAELLIRYGAHLDPVDDEYKSTPLGMAVKWGQTEMARYLLEQGADPNKAGADWATPLAWAKKKNHPDIEEMLLRSGAVHSSR